MIMSQIRTHFNFIIHCSLVLKNKMKTTYVTYNTINTLLICIHFYLYHNSLRLFETTMDKVNNFVLY